MALGFQFTDLDRTVFYDKSYFEVEMYDYQNNSVPIYPCTETSSYNDAFAGTKDLDHWSSVLTTSLCVDTSAIKFLFPGGLTYFIRACSNQPYCKSPAEIEAAVKNTV